MRAIRIILLPSNGFVQRKSRNISTGFTSIRVKCGRSVFVLLNRNIVLLAAIFLLLVSVIGCSNSSQDSVGIRGEITKITLSEDNRITSILVEGEVESDTVYDKASVRIVEDTVILDNSGQDVSLQELRQGMKVEVVFQGAVAESYPVQGNAKAIRVIQ